MVEFIVNLETLNFVSQWDVLRLKSTEKYLSDPTCYTKEKLSAIADTESFNYGIPHGKGGHGDLVSSGGIKDIIYWKSIPDNKRLEVYHGYTTETS